MAIVYEVPQVRDYGSIAAHTFMPVPPGCAPADCAGHKGFFNPETPDGSDAELSHGLSP
ncbi:MAG: hypothetical protein ACRDOS_00120 [Gaiellaceae bacterium]